jgi:hypothetical protein
LASNNQVSGVDICDGQLLLMMKDFTSRDLLALIFSRLDLVRLEELLNGGKVPHSSLFLKSFIIDAVIYFS